MPRIWKQNYKKERVSTSNGSIRNITSCFHQEPVLLPHVSPGTATTSCPPSWSISVMSLFSTRKNRNVPCTDHTPLMSVGEGGACLPAAPCGCIPLVPEYGAKGYPPEGTQGGTPFPFSGSGSRRRLYLVRHPKRRSGGVTMKAVKTVVSLSGLKGKSGNIGFYHDYEDTTNQKIYLMWGYNGTIEVIDVMLNNFV